MYGNELMGGVVGVVGWDNFSPVARGVGKILTESLSTAEIMPTTSITVYDDGNVLEVVNVIVNNIQWFASVQILNGRVVDVQHRKVGTAWQRVDVLFLTFLSFGGKTYQEKSATIDFYDSIESSAEWDEIEDERALLREMMDDTDRYHHISEGAWDRMIELGI